MNKTKTNPFAEALKSTFSDLKAYVKAHWPILILILVGFLAVSVENFFNVAMSQTVFSYRMEDFEIGQIADRTIFAPKSIPADEMNPVFVEEGEKIIRKGFPITEEAYSKLQKMSESPHYIDSRSFADSELYLALLITMWFLLFTFAPFDRDIRLRELIFQTVCFLLVYAAVAFCGKVSFFATPFDLAVIVPASLFILIIAILYGQLSAIFCSFVFAFGVFNSSNYEAVPFLFTLASCLASSTIVRKIEKRIDMVFVALLLAVINAVVIILLAVIFNNSILKLPVVIGLVALNGFLSGVLALGLITPIELLLNTASVFRLMDLSDSNNTLMRKLLLTASGTYQHSQMVAQLSESACREIGANSLLARVAAFYHDIGKIDQSEYFTENDMDGQHKLNEMKPNLAATLIRSHVRKGVEKARQLHFPQQVIDIIEQHHGNSVIAYFYAKAQEEDPGVNVADYMYPGTPPKTKESGVVMLADTVEAACKSLDNPTEERLEKFIDTLISGKMEHGQLDNCDLTFGDLKKIKSVFVKILSAYYHGRIKYPNQKDPDSESKTDEKKLKTEKSEKSEKNEKSEKAEKASRKSKSEKKDAVLGDKTLDEAKLNG